MSKAVFNGSVSFGTPLQPASITTTITVYKSDDATITSLWSDRDGTTAIPNPFTISEIGKFQFYANPDIEYDIVASDGASSATFNDVLLQSKEQSGRTASASFTISSTDINQYIETTGAANIDITVPTEAADPLINDGFIIHGEHLGTGTLSFIGTPTINVNTDLVAQVPQFGVWSLVKSRSASDTWNLFGYLVKA